MRTIAPLCSEPHTESAGHSVQTEEQTMGSPVVSSAISALAFCVLLLALFTQSGCRLWNRTSVSSKETLESRQCLQQAVDLLDDGETDEGTRALAQAVKANPKNYEARAMYAEQLWKAGNQETAIIQMQLAVRSEDATAEMYIQLAQMFYETGSYDDAQKALTNGLRRDATNPAAWVLQGKLYEQNHQPDRALAAFHQALFHDPENTEAMVHLADSYLRAGKPQRALEIAQYSRNRGFAASSEDPNTPALLYREGLAMTQLKRYTDALEVLTLAANQTSQPLGEVPATPTQVAEHAQILTALANAQFQAGHPAEAASTARQALAFSPSNEQCLNIVAQTETPTLAPPRSTAVSAPVTPQYGSNVETTTNGGKGPNSDRRDATH